MANNNESSPQKEELVKVEAEKDVIESSATHSEVGDLMEIHLHHAQSLGELILDGRHTPFRALACPLKPSVVRSEREAKRHK